MSEALRAIVPTGAEAAVRDLQLSPAVAANGFVFVTGMTGSAPDGTMPCDPATQFRAALGKIDAVLREAGTSFAHVVDMTSYHVAIDEHFEAFRAARADYVSEPFPAWTAVEVAKLRRKGALVEVRVVASIPERQGRA